MDEATGLTQSIFTPTKSKLDLSGIQFLKKLRNKGINMENIRYNDAGENKELEENTMNDNMNINCEYTSVGTPH